MYPRRFATKSRDISALLNSIIILITVIFVLIGFWPLEPFLHLFFELVSQLGMVAKNSSSSLPEFMPSSLGADDSRWPSAIHVHDASHELSFWYAPPFLSQLSLAASSPQYLSLDDFEQCPLWLFSRITIRISPPSLDPASFIMDWNRLKYTGYVLHNSWSLLARRRDSLEFCGIKLPGTSLPAVNIQFLEHASYSWFDSRGELRTSLNVVRQFLSDGTDQVSPDLVLLLRALAPVRGARSMNIDIPFRLPISEDERNFSVKWFSNIHAQKHQFGEYMELGAWADRESIEWLQRCQLILHQALHRLDSKLAPYLRLEQLAFIDHMTVSQLCHHASRYSKDIYTMACKYMKSIMLCSYTLSPRKGSGVCRCLGSPRGPRKVWSAIALPVTGENVPEWFDCLLDKSQLWISAWIKAKGLWEKEFQEVYQKLQAADTSREVITLDQVEGFRRPRRPRRHNYNSESEENWGDSTSTYYSVSNRCRCTCFTPDLDRGYCLESWLKEWPKGIIRTVSTVQKAEEEHCCHRTRGVLCPESVYHCLHT